MENYSPEAEISGFPLYEQPDGISCGPTSLRMLLEFYGKKHSLEEIRKKTRTDFYVKGGYEIGGTTIENIKAGMDSFGLSSTIHTGSMHDLRWYVDQGRPPIVLLRSGMGNLFHYVVVIGYTENTIIVADPGYGERTEYSNEQFERAWSYTHELYSGETTLVDCWVCGGDGRKFDWLGPFGSCDNCAGSGKLHDIWWIMMETMGQSPYMFVVA